MASRYSHTFRALLRRIATSLAILLAIAYLTMFGLIVGERGQAGLPAEPLNATLEALRRTLDYVINHPATYHWQRQDVSAPGLVLNLLGRSAALLLAALGLATITAIPLGMAAALSRRLRTAPLVLLLSILGVSTPSFLLAMLFWVINTQAYRTFGLQSAPLPPIGFGWDAHLVMPALVLATRPLAQIVQVTYVSLSNVLGEDYIRTAQAKGLAGRVVITRHALRNILIPVMTTLGTSLRFSLASLPVVEIFFVWPGAGRALLQAIELGNAWLVTDLIVSLGFLFLVINLALDLIYQIVDPRLRGSNQTKEHTQDQPTWQERWDDLKQAWLDLGVRLPAFRFPWQRDKPAQSPCEASRLQAVTPHQASGGEHPLSHSPRHYLLRSVLRNPPLLIGTLLVTALLGLALWGARLASASPYETHGVMMVEGKINAPPFAPSSQFPWGSDAVGRDIQALVLAGARQTLTMALLGMMARMLLGTGLGMLAGWWQDSWLDRLISSVVAVWAAFPVTLFAMILILALGIQEGMSVFVITLCVVGWGEIAQFVRGQVMGLKPQLYIEAARAVGAHTGRILSRHILPHLWAPLLVLATLEMGSILLLLAELGFLNIFLGGGFRAEIGTTSMQQSIVYYFSDVPEWGALLANIRNWWRSYPWMAWYPGVTFFMAILSFNLWGEGLRRFLEDSRFNIGRVINRYTVIAAGIAILGGTWLVRSTAALEMYKEQIQQFNTPRAMRDILTLASPPFQGRETGLAGAQAAAEYIAAEMEAMGLFPAGDNETFFYSVPAPRPHLAQTPRLEIVQGQAVERLVHRQDFTEHVGYRVPSPERTGAIVGIALGPDPSEAGTGATNNLVKLGLGQNVIIVREAAWAYLERGISSVSGVLLVPADGEETKAIQRKYLFPAYPFGYGALSAEVPVMIITPQVAEHLLATANSSLAQLDALANSLPPNQVASTGPGVQVRMAIPQAAQNLDEKYHYVIGFIPGTGALMGEGEGSGLDSKVIIVSAYYDGLGTDPDGRLYPSANDNASGVAAMLEIARAIKQSPLQPRKTIVFVAWPGGERWEGFSVKNTMTAKRGFNLLTVETVIELSGVGAGSGSGIALGPGTSFSMVQLFQDAAKRVGVPVTTRGRGPHFDMFTPSGFGGRSALSAYVSWDGSDQTAHTTGDTPEAIDPAKVAKLGQTTFLVVSTLGQAEAEETPLKPLAQGDGYVQGARMFDEGQALKHIEYLASDELEGRRPGTPGGQKAGDYIAARFVEYGLQPAGSGGTYFQPFSLPYTTLVESPILAVTFPSLAVTSGAPLTRSYTYHTDYIPYVRRALGSGEAHGQVVWFGECDTNKLGSSLADKIVLCQSSSVTPYERLVEQALKYKISGLLLIREDAGPYPRPSYRIGNLTALPAFWITEAIAQDLIAGSSYTLDDLERLSVPTPLSTTVHMAASIQAREVEARNVLGLLPGTDPQHKDEIVVIGAHYDHMGRDPDGTIYNGANDNASGVAVMLEIARLWQAQGFRPARSVLFAAWDDEEQGLLGSHYYAYNSIYPLDRTVAMLNLDMVGVGEELIISGRGIMATQLQASTRVYSVTATIEPQAGGSDDASFQDVGVSAGSYFMFPVIGSDLELAYHRPEDDVQNILPGSLRTVGVLSAHTMAAWSGGGPTLPLPAAGPSRTLRDLILPTPVCPTPWPLGSMTCDHGQWSR
ncbi:MAG: M28 family peptidase [Thermoflexales bacterium]|nr:M28 family peptidase [Thermoflexales bacterium]